MQGEDVIQNAAPGGALSDGGTDVRTFLIADMRGYTSFTVEHGDAAAARLASTFAGLTRDAITARGGEVIELRGDEALAVFSSTRQALWAASELQGQLAQASISDTATPLKAGIGIDAGEAIPIEGGYRGAALNLAARLSSLAGAGEILVTEAITHLARKVDGLEYVERGAMELKGFAEPVMVLEVRPVLNGSQESVPVTQGAVSDEQEQARGSTVQTLPIGGFLGALPSGLLVARDDELKRAMTSVDAVERGRGRLLLLTGEPGVGKTRLAQEVTLGIRNRGFLVAAGSCYEARMSSAYYPWVDVLSVLYRLAAPRLRSQVPQRFSYLAKLLPNENLTVSTAGDGQEEQDRLFWSVTGFLQAMAEEHPLAVLLDDLHWADGSSLDLLQHLTRHTRGDRVLILATYRDVEVGRQHPLEAALRDLSREDLAERIAVRRLGEEGTAQLLASALDREEISEEFAELLYQRTEGNPFFLQQVLRVLVERGDVFQRDGGWTRKAIAEIEVPESIRSVVGQRLSRLSEEAQDILREASVLGQTFLFDDLLTMAGRDEKEIERSLESAMASGLVREKAADAYSFDHALTQQSLYGELTSRRRRKLHLAAGEAIEGLPERKREKRVDELAWHFLQADDMSRALTYTLQAGEAAQAVYANGDAELHFRTAAELAREVEDLPHEAQALEKLGEILFTSARYAEQFEIADRAARLYARLGDLEGEGRVVARRAWGHAMAESVPEGISLIRNVIARFDDREPSPAHFALHESLATLAWRANQAAEALTSADRSLELARALGDERLMARAEGRRGLVLTVLDRGDEALAALDVAMSLAERIGDLDTLLRAQNNAAVVYLRLGDGDRFEELQRRNVELARQAGDPGGMIFALALLYGQLFEQGEWAEARALLDEALRLFRQTPVGRFNWLLTMPGYRLLLDGDIEGANASWTECLAEAERSGATDLRLGTVWLQAESEWLAGRPEVAVARLEREVDRLDLVPPEARFPLRLQLGLLWLESGKVNGAERAHVQLSLGVEERIDAPNGIFDFDARPLQAWLAARQGDRALASRLMEEAIALARKLGFLWSEARMLQVWGRLETDLQDPEAARAHLDAALAIYRRLGAVPHIEETERQLARLGT